MRCALKAKNVIIEQLEAEKTHAMTEASRQFELKILELNDKLQAFQTAAANVSLLHCVGLSLLQITECVITLSLPLS